MPRYWECDCCGSLLVTADKDSATKYSCPQCTFVKCEEPGPYLELTQAEFIVKAGICLG